MELRTRSSGRRLVAGLSLDARTCRRFGNGGTREELCRRRPRIFSGESKLRRVPGKILSLPRDHQELAMEIFKFRRENLKYSV